jgi:hypothetical protein
MLKRLIIAAVAASLVLAMAGWKWASPHHRIAGWTWDDSAQMYWTDE